MMGASAVVTMDGEHLEGRFFLSDQRLVFESEDHGPLWGLVHLVTGKAPTLEVRLDVPVPQLEALQPVRGSGSVNALALEVRVQGDAPFVLETPDLEKTLKSLTVLRPKLKPAPRRAAG